MENTYCRIIGLLQQKGGVGKTTLSLNMAGYFAKAGERVLLVDADPQGSSLAWCAEREEQCPFSVIGKAVPNLHKDLPDLARGYDRVIVDGAPRNNELIRSCILASEFVLMPVQPSKLDIWACQDVTQLLSEARQFHQSLNAAFVINRKIKNTVIGKKVAKEFESQDFPVLEAPIHQRVIYAESVEDGKTVFEMEGENALKAQLEIARLCKELKNNKERTTA